MKTKTPDLNILSASVDALIDGLRISDLSLCDHCMRALSAIGPRVVPLLNFALNNADTSSHRRRLVDAVELVEDTGQESSESGQLVWNALLECLRVDDEQLNEKATEAISLMPGPMIHDIFTQATYHRRKKGMPNDC